MTISLTKKQLIAFDPCDIEQRLEMFGDRDAMNVSEALEAGFSVSDILWIAGRLDLKMQCVDFSIRCAKRVAHLNTDPRVQAAIDAAEAWLNDPTEENRLATSAAEARAAAAYRKLAESLFILDRRGSCMSRKLGNTSPRQFIVWYWCFVPGYENGREIISTPADWTDTRFGDDAKRGEINL